MFLTSTVDEDVEAAKLIGHRSFQIKQGVIFSQVTLDSDCLRWILLSYYI